MKRECTFLQPTRGSGERHKLPQQGTVHSPAGNGFWCILRFKKPMCRQENLVFLTFLRSMQVTSDPQNKKKQVKLKGWRHIKWGTEPLIYRQFPHRINILKHDCTHNVRKNAIILCRYWLCIYVGLGNSSWVVWLLICRPREFITGSMTAEMY